MAYSIHHFGSFLSPDPSPSPSPYSPRPPTYSSSSSSNSSSSVGVAIRVAAAIVFIVIVITIFVCICMRRKKAKKLASNGAVSTHNPLMPIAHHYAAGSVASHSNGSSHFGYRGFTFKELSLATKQFSKTELLGQGGSGSVYRGKLREDGTLVAVKCIAKNSSQGMKEFNAEVSIISELRHRNLVKLKGWCCDGDRFLLVYEYMPNGSLDYFLYNDAFCCELTWERRFSITSGLGSALVYLHEECDRVIIHRDVKSSNVLLDEGFVAKLGDFGLSRQVDLGVTSHMTAVVAGTRGYMAPECSLGTGKATKEMDVYAFGVVLLEVASGRRPLDASLQIKYRGMLVDWVWDLFGQGRVLQAVDKRLGMEWDREEAKRMLVVGLACSHPDAHSRPTMRRALDALNGTVGLLYVPLSKPPFSFGSSPPMSMSGIMSQSIGTESITTSSSGTSTNSYSTHSSGCCETNALLNLNRQY